MTRIIAAAICLASLVILGIAISSNEKPIQKIEVIDRYQNCDIIRYTTPSQSWEYFLHCPEK